MHDSCMATKTITLELDAYEELRRRKGPGDSFTTVVRRMASGTETLTAAQLLGRYRAEGAHLTEEDCDAIDALNANDKPPAIP